MPSSLAVRSAFSSRRRRVALTLLALLVIGVGVLFLPSGAPGRKAVFLARHMECFERPHNGGVAAIGDSITAGTSDPDWGFLGANSWFNQVVCNTDGLPYDYNAGIPDNTTEMVAARLPDLLERDPDVVVVFSGTNDILKRRSLTSAVTLIDQMAGEIRTHGATPVLATVPPFRENPAGSIEFNRMIRAYAGAHGVMLIDFYSTLGDGEKWRPGLTDDGLHPNVAGSEAMAKVAAPVLLRLTRRP